MFFGLGSDIAAVRDSVLTHFETRRVDAEVSPATGERTRTFLGVEIVECSNKRVFKARQPALVRKILADFIPTGERPAFVRTPITKAEIEQFEKDEK
jgi:hypothetical protein